MSTEPERSKIPEEALEAFLDGVLAEIKTPADPVLLDRMRSLFRKHVPFHLRSYAAALLILRAAGLAQGASQPPKAGKIEPSRARQAPAAKKNSPPREQKESREPKETGGQSARTSSAHMVPLFVSMGKRQRLRPQELRDLVGQKAGVDAEALGRVHLFDNYSFLDVKEELAARIVEAADGLEYNGRPLEIKPAKRKGEAAAPKDEAE